MNIDKILNIIRNLNEEGIPTNNASGGAIAGLPPDEPPVKKKRKQTPWHRLEGNTNFYPQYLDGARDRVTPIAPVQPNEFQRVEPRYQLSMSETRGTGLGPMFLEVEYPTPEQRVNSVVNAKKREEEKEAEQRKRTSLA